MKTTDILTCLFLYIIACALFPPLWVATIFIIIGGIVLFILGQLWLYVDIERREQREKAQARWNKYF